MSSRKVKVIIGILAVVVLVMLAAAHSRKSNYTRNPQGTDLPHNHADVFSQARDSQFFNLNSR